jgi:hypothetical protein
MGLPPYSTVIDTAFLLRPAQMAVRMRRPSVSLFTVVPFGLRLLQV